MLTNQRQFGRKTEKNTSSVPDGQMNLFEFFNETESLSKATPSIVASTMNAKYALANPLDRQSKYFKDNGVNLSTNTLANWMIKFSEDYLLILYDIFHKKLYEYNLLHADETPVKVSNDGRTAGSKSLYVGISWKTPR